MESSGKGKSVERKEVNRKKSRKANQTAKAEQTKALYLRKECVRTSSTLFIGGSTNLAVKQWIEFVVARIEVGIGQLGRLIGEQHLLRLFRFF